MEKDFLSENARNLPSSAIRTFFDVAKKRKDCISLAIGESDFDMPFRLSTKLACLKKSNARYTQNAGLYPLRQLISQFIERRINVQYDAGDEIIVTVGASEGIDVSLRAIINIGDEIIIPTPNFVCYAPLIRLAGGVPIEIQCGREDDYKLTPKALLSAITPRTKGIILSYPNNPTGAIMTIADLRSVAEIVKQNDLIVISDEIYSTFVYGEKFTSIASLDDMRERTIIISGFSKCFAMTGYRIGYVCAPKEIARVIYKLHQYSAMCAPTISQNVAIDILRHTLETNFSQTQKLVEKCDRSRKFLLKRLDDIGINCFEPKGAFYAFANVAEFATDGNEFAYSLLEKKNVALVPGDAFSTHTKDCVRISFATPIKKLDIALKRIDVFCRYAKK